MAHPKFGDVKPLTIPSGYRRPGKAVLVSAHQNEGITPFQQVCAAQLQSEGIQAEEQSIDGNMERGWSLTIHRAEKGFDKLDERDICNNIFLMEDYLLRARLVSGALSDKSAFVLEIHAMDKYGPNDTFMGGEWYRRIRGTSILAGDFASFFNRFDFRPLSQMEAHEVEVTVEFAEARGLNYPEALKEIAARQEEALAYRERAKLIGLPSTPVSLPAGHPMYSFYYNTGGSMKILPPFEEAYCSCTRELSPFTPKDVSRVASIARIPPG